MAGKGVEAYPSGVTDEAWAFVLPYLLLCRENSPQRKHDLRTGSTRFAMWRGRAASGVFFRANLVRGGSCTSRCSAG